MAQTALTRAFILCISALSALHAQTRMGGTVLDPTRSLVGGAQIRTESGRKTTSSKDGRFAMDLETGPNTITISKEGFTPISRTITVGPDGNESLEFVLQVAPARNEMSIVDGGGYLTTASSTATRTLTPLRDVPQSVATVTSEQIQDQLMMSIGDVVRYVPGVTAIQGENNRDQIVIRGNSTSADFYLDGIRDDVQFYRDLYNSDRIEILKGPNAMVFGRGGGGGVVNRVGKEAGPTVLREFTLSGGSFGDKRATVDLDQPFGPNAFGGKVSARLNGVFENSGSFRDHVRLERYGINPALTWTPGSNTRLTFAFENFHDRRTADRGIPSWQGRPIDVPVGLYFGNPDDSRVRALVNSGSFGIEHQAGAVSIHSRLRVADYDRGYQNYVAGAVTANGLQDSLSAYNNATQRRNLFHQTDITRKAQTGRVRHTLLGGIEEGRQLTNNFRNTGYFNGSATSVLIPIGSPTFSTRATFRQSATDADNHLQTNVGAAFVQDQFEVSRYVQFIAGVRFDHFDLQFHNNRSGDNLRRIDNLVSPRAGVVFKPVTAVSVYGSYSVGWLPSSGDQFSSLTTITQQVKPEKFTNREVGVKWDAARSLQLTAAAFRQDRTNSRSTDPNDATRIVQTGSQRTNGWEAGASGSVTAKWKIAGGYAWQDAFITSATVTAFAGARVAQTPHHSFSVWNHYQIVPRVGAGLGIVQRSEMFAAVDNTVRLAGYTRADAAVYFSVTEKIRLQANVENLAGTRYYLNADNNNNISPGSPRAVRVGLTARF
jgi:catecholate siderophore receptor